MAQKDSPLQIILQEPSSTKQKHFFVKQHRNVIFQKNIHRIGFLDPKSDFPQRIFIGLDSSIRDLVDFRGRKMEFTFFKILNK